MDESRARRPGSLEDLENKSVVGKALIDEILRLRTPGLFFRKVVAPKGFSLSTGHHIPYGDYISFSTRYLNTLPQFYQDPHTFDIDRFISRDEQKAAGLYALAWGGGRHPCSGSRFAQMEIIIICSYLFEHFDLIPGPELPRINKSQIATVDKPSQPVYLSYKRR